MTQIASQEDVDKILKAFYLVYNTLGYGFLERVYQNALYFELIEQGFKCEVQKQINVFYKIGYLLNFGKHPEFKRKIFSHH